MKKIIDFLRIIALLLIIFALSFHIQNEFIAREEKSVEKMQGKIANTIQNPLAILEEQEQQDTADIPPENNIAPNSPGNSNPQQQSATTNTGPTKLTRVRPPLSESDYVKASDIKSLASEYGLPEYELPEYDLPQYDLPTYDLPTYDIP